MVVADCEVCAPYNNAPENQVHAQICPHAAPFLSLMMEKAVGSLRSTVEDVDLHTSWGCDYTVDPSHLNVLQNRGDLTVSENPSVEIYIEKSFVGNFHLPSECLRMTQNGMLEEARRHGRPLSSPETPSMETLESRQETFTRDTCVLQPSQILRCSQSGFFKAVGNNVKCFHCGISFRGENFEDSSWDIRREHARWSPFCGYIRQISGTGVDIPLDISGEVNSEQEKNPMGNVVLPRKMEDKRMFM